MFSRLRRPATLSLAPRRRRSPPRSRSTAPRAAHRYLFRRAAAQDGRASGRPPPQIADPTLRARARGAPLVAARAAQAHTRRPVAGASSGRWRSSVIVQGTRAGAAVRAGSSSSSSAGARLRAPPARDSSRRRRMPSGSSFARDRRARRGSGAAVMHPPLARAPRATRGGRRQFRRRPRVGAAGGAAAAQPIDRLVARDGGQPGDRTGLGGIEQRGLAPDGDVTPPAARPALRLRRAAARRQMPYNLADVRS